MQNPAGAPAPAIESGDATIAFGLAGWRCFVAVEGASLQEKEARAGFFARDS
jgi:hypothetical protein